MDLKYPIATSIPALCPPLQLLPYEVCGIREPRVRQTMTLLEPRLPIILYLSIVKDPIFVSTVRLVVSGLSHVYQPAWEKLTKSFVCLISSGVFSNLLCAVSILRLHSSMYFCMSRM